LIILLKCRSRLEQMMLEIGRGLVLHSEPVPLVFAPFAGHLSMTEEKPPFVFVQIVSACGISVSVYRLEVLVVSRVQALGLSCRVTSSAWPDLVACGHLGGLPDNTSKALRF
jgi:hypothetical protein